MRGIEREGLPHWDYVQYRVGQSDAPIHAGMQSRFRGVKIEEKKGEHSLRITTECEHSLSGWICVHSMHILHIKYMLCLNIIWYWFMWFCVVLIIAESSHSWGSNIWVQIITNSVDTRLALMHSTYARSHCKILWVYGKIAVHLSGIWYACTTEWWFSQSVQLKICHYSNNSVLVEFFTNDIFQTGPFEFTRISLSLSMPAVFIGQICYNDRQNTYNESLIYAFCTCVLVTCVGEQIVCACWRSRIGTLTVNHDIHITLTHRCSHRRNATYPLLWSSWMPALPARYGNWITEHNRYKRKMCPFVFLCS